MLSQKNKILLLSLFIMFLDYVSIGLVYPLFSSLLFSNEFALLPSSATVGERGFYLGILLTCMPLVLFFSAPLIGGFSDHVGRKKIIVACAYMGVAGYLISFAAILYTNLWLLLFSRAIIGISAASGAVIAAVLTDIATPSERPKFFGWYNMVLGLGLATGPFLGGILTSVSNDPMIKYAFPFAMAAFIILFTAIFIQKIMVETSVPKEPKSYPKISQKIEDIGRAFVHPKLSRLFIVLGIFSFGWSFYWEFIPVTWIAAFNFSSFDIGAVYGFAAGMYALSCGLIIQPLSKYFKSEHLFLIGLLGCALMFGLMGIIQNSLLIWVLVPLQQIFLSLLFPASSTLIADNTQEDEQGEMQGIRQSIISLACATAPLLSGSLLGLSVYSPIYIGIFSMLSAAFLLKTKKEKHPSRVN